MRCLPAEQHFVASHTCRLLLTVPNARPRRMEGEEKGSKLAWPARAAAGVSLGAAAGASCCRRVAVCAAARCRCGPSTLAVSDRSQATFGGRGARMRRCPRAPLRPTWRRSAGAGGAASDPLPGTAKNRADGLATVRKSKLVGVYRHECAYGPPNLLLVAGSARLPQSWFLSGEVRGQGVASSHGGGEASVPAAARDADCRWLFSGSGVACKVACRESLLPRGPQRFQGLNGNDRT